MSRTVIAAVVAAVIAGLTAIAYFVTSQSFEERARKDADIALTRAHQVVQRLNQLQGIDVSNKAERLAALPEFVGAIKSSGDDRRRQAQIGFQKFMSADKEGAIKPDIIALVDDSGDMLAMHEVPAVVPKQWKNAKDESILPALNVVLRKRVIISDIWDYGEKGMMKIGVAPIIDPDNVNPKNPEGVAIIGAIVVAYAQTANSARNDKDLLGTEIAYFDGKRVVASSFVRDGSKDEDRAKAGELRKLLESGKVSDAASKQRITIDGTDYLIAAVKMPRKTTKELPPPPEYPPVTAGALVMSPILSASNAGTVKMFVLLLGIGALAIAMLGIYHVHRRLMAQVDQIEQGVTDMINGNVDRTFQPVGSELDGLANGLNVMLARLLGRPEPGEEEFDEEGNQIVPGKVEFDEGEAVRGPGVDADIAALAQESEPDYYKRVYTEYVAAKRASGKPDEVSFENFIAKLKVNEGKLKAQYNCRAVRFRVVTNDGKVTLKPVPIYA
ncbi:MAG: hypothetical protein H0T65_18450 [Deltaproteobacteria bacterium]|nr:hypothetical protein [Deltaproteobacteria bacterium]